MISRDAIVAALGKVPELTPSLTQPSALLAGAAWPVWDHTEGINRCVFRDFWQVVVVLAAPDRTTTVTDGDALREPVGVALFSVPAFVDRVEPTQIQAEDGGQAVPALLFTISQ